MKLTLYRATVLVLTNALTGLVAFAFGGAYANRILEKKDKPLAGPKTKIVTGDNPRVVPDGFVPSMLKEDLEVVSDESA